MIRLFTEDECLRHDPTYPGIEGWWKETYGRDFKADWIAAGATEIDHGDHFTRRISFMLPPHEFKRMRNGVPGRCAVCKCGCHALGHKVDTVQVLDVTFSYDGYRVDQLYAATGIGQA